MSESTAAVLSAEDAIAAFEYTQLSEVDPKFKGSLVAEGNYKVEIVRGYREDYILKDTSSAVQKGRAKAGDPAVRYKLDLVVVDDENFAARRLFVTRYPSVVTAQEFRNVQDATGYQQEPGQSLSDWLKGMEGFTPRLCMELPVHTTDSFFKKNPDGTPEQENTVDLRKSKPAQRS